MINKVGCGDPQAPDNGIINSYTSTIEGAQITFQCNDDPSNVTTSTCSSAGVWEPDPAMIMCQATTTETTPDIGELSGMLMITILIVYRVQNLSKHFVQTVQLFSVDCTVAGVILIKNKAHYMQNIIVHVYM